MANFETAFKITDKLEGFYANHHFDNGGETYRGVARKHNKRWDGWIIIDLP
jgi:lysozyme family protein